MQGWLVILIRSIIMLFITLILIRVMGKRQPARMNPFNFVNYMVIALIAGLVALNVIARLKAIKNSGVKKSEEIDIMTEELRPNLEERVLQSSVSGNVKSEIILITFLTKFSYQQKKVITD